MAKNSQINNMSDPQNTMTMNPRKRVQIMFPEESLTKQSFKDECDINNVVKKFINTGQLPVTNNIEPQYGEAPSIDLKTSLDMVKELHREFDNLPDALKAEFDNNPTIYGQFLSDYENSPEDFYKDVEASTDTPVQKTGDQGSEALSGDEGA